MQQIGEIDQICEKKIEERVSLWIDGKHGRIGIISPENKATPEEWVWLHRKIAEIALQSAKKDEAAN